MEIVEIDGKDGHIYRLKKIDEIHEILMAAPEEITKKVNEVIAKYVDTSAFNLYKLIDGSSIKRQIASNPIAIQDLVRRINGSGLKLHNFFFFY